MDELMKVNKATARRAFNSGFDVLLLPSKLDINVMMFRGQRIAAGYLSFDESVNNFENDNCYSEIGLTARFYMFNSDYQKYLKR